TEGLCFSHDLPQLQGSRSVRADFANGHVDPRCRSTVPETEAEGAPGNLSNSGGDLVHDLPAPSVQRDPFRSGAFSGAAGCPWEGSAGHLQADFALSDLHPHGRVGSSPAEMAHTDSQSSVRSHFCRTPTAHACPADGSGASGIPQRRNHAATGTRAGVEAGIPAGTESARRNNWPTMLLVAFHDALTVLAMRPSWGAM